jgi:hypothetical protein
VPVLAEVAGVAAEAVVAASAPAAGVAAGAAAEAGVAEAVLTVYSVVCDRGTHSGSTRTACCSSNQCGLVLGHSRTARQKKPQHTQR